MSRPSHGVPPLLIAVGSGHQVYHEYLLSLVSRYARIWVFLDDEPAWAKIYSTGYTVVDTRDSTAVVDAAQRLARTMRVDGVLCLDSSTAVQSADAGASLGLPISDPAVVRRCQDLDEARDALAASGVPHVQATDPHADHDDLTCDAACVEGEVFPVFVSRPIEAVFPQLAGTGHVVDASDTVLADEPVIDLITAAHQAIGVRSGVTHTRVRLTKGEPRIVGVDWGLSGDLVPYAASIATGIDPGRVLVQVARGIRPETCTVRHNRVAAIQFFTARHDEYFGAVQLDETSLPLSVDVVETLTVPAQRSAGRAGAGHSRRCAYTVVVDNTVEDCARALAAAEGALRETARCPA